MTFERRNVESLDLAVVNLWPIFLAVIVLLTIGATSTTTDAIANEERSGGEKFARQCAAWAFKWDVRIDFRPYRITGCYCRSLTPLGIT